MKQRLTNVELERITDTAAGEYLGTRSRQNAIIQRHRDNKLRGIALHKRIFASGFTHSSCYAKADPPATISDGSVNNLEDVCNT